MNIGPSLEGAYDAAMEQSLEGWGFGSLKRLAKKAGRGLKKGVKRGYRFSKKGLRKGYRVSKRGVKLSLKPVKYAAKAGKYALRAMAKLAAKPIVYVFRKLAGRRAKYLSYAARGSLRPTGSEKRQAAGWALRKVGGAGPVGKLGVRILKFVGASQSAGLGGGWSGELDGWAKGYEQDAAACGMTGAEIAAAAVTIVAAISGVMKSLNRPGQAPSNPAAAARREPEEDTQPTIEDADEESEEDSAGFFGPARLRRKLRRIKRGRVMRRLLRRRGVPLHRISRLAVRRRGIPKPPPPPRRRPPPPKAPPPPRRRTLANLPPGIRKG